jgi:2-amino-4-hydroxy-6-hydroxymethyldihydropteridine diphosphokinase
MMAKAASAPGPRTGCTVLLALGSNRRHGRHGAPAAVLHAAVAALAAAGIAVHAVSRIHSTAPVGPSSRRYANAAVAGTWPGDAGTLLATTQAIERAFGRTPGQRWGQRVLDIDILALGDAVIGWHPANRGLAVPHRALHQRGFVLDPLADVAPRWHHPVLRLSVAQMRARLRKPARPRKPRHGRARV